MCIWPLLVAQMVKNLLQCRRPRFNPWSSMPWRRAGYPLQYSWLENSMDRGAWKAAIHGITESDTTEQLTLSVFFFFVCLYIMIMFKKKNFENKGRNLQKGKKSLSFGFLKTQFLGSLQY